MEFLFLKQEHDNAKLNSAEDLLTSDSSSIDLSQVFSALAASGRNNHLKPHSNFYMSQSDISDLNQQQQNQQQQQIHQQLNHMSQMGPGGHHHNQIAHIHQMHNHHQGYTTSQMPGQQNFILHPHQIAGYTENADNCTPNNNSGDEDEDDDDESNTNESQMSNVFNSKEYQSLRTSGYHLGLNHQASPHHQALGIQDIQTYIPEDLINSGIQQPIYGASQFNNQQRIIQHQQQHQQHNHNISILDVGNNSSTTSPNHPAITTVYDYYSPHHPQANYHPTLRSQLQFYQGGQSNPLQQQQQQHSANHLASHSQSNMYHSQMMSAPHFLSSQFNEIPAITQILNSNQQTWQTPNRY